MKPNRQARCRYNKNTDAWIIEILDPSDNSWTLSTAVIVHHTDHGDQITDEILNKFYELQLLGYSIKFM